MAPPSNGGPPNDGGERRTRNVGPAGRLVQELGSQALPADDLVDLARKIYVQVLLKVRYAASGERVDRAINMAITCRVLSLRCGFHFDQAEVQMLLDGVEHPDPIAEAALGADLPDMPAKSAEEPTPAPKPKAAG